MKCSAWENSVSAGIPYGTPEMAAEIHRLFKERDTWPEVIAMVGYQGGLISFG